jgi:hypothetical protein
MHLLTENFLLPALEARLRSIGGQVFYLNESLKEWRQSEEYINRTLHLLKCGQEFDGANAVMVPGDSGMCHANTAALYFISHGQLEMWTGWGLNDLGGWTEHTWGRYRDKIYDSAGKWCRYFGFKIAQQEKCAVIELSHIGRLRDDPKEYIESCFGSESWDLLTTIFNETLTREGEKLG